VILKVKEEGDMKKLFGLAVGLAASVSAVAWAEPARTAAAPPSAASSVTAAAEALTRGESMEALTRADEALRADPKNAWAHYNRAAALAALNRVDEALTAYDTAAARFAASDKRGRSLALWGKSHLLYRTGRCQEASQAFTEYSKFVGSSDPQATQLAAHRASTCRPGAASESPAETASVTPPPAPKGGDVKIEPGTEVKPASTMPSLSK
jgi:tetratricopeptide (TPR) repeat protein